MAQQLTEEQKQVVAMIRDFVQREVLPVANEMDNKDEYPKQIVDKMAELGLFGITIPEKYGGMGMGYTTFALIFEELCKGWMSVSGVIGTHHVMVYMINHFGTEEQKQRWLPRMARGELRGGLALTEPNAGSDVQAIQSTAIKSGDHYIVNGTKAFITNAQHGNCFALVAKTDPKATPAYRGISCFIVEKGAPGLTVSKHLDKLGYRGVDTVELAFQDLQVPAANLIGEKEGQGFSQALSALEGGRVNVAARAVGVATAAFEAAIKYAQQRQAFGKPIAEHQAIQMKLADMATKIEAARLLTYWAAEKKDSGERADMEVAMAKLFASETCLEVAMESMRIHGGYGFIKDLPIERYFRDAPLMIVGEGTNEIQKIIIAGGLLRRYKI